MYTGMYGRSIVTQLSGTRPFGAITIPYMDLRWVSANGAHGILTKRSGSLVTICVLPTSSNNHISHH